ncbi:Small glutamine-rich tetratricopeptide repeat-containing protein 2 [Colletotrichum chlorophyti]|uniref:Small glutamine-rich tetratricopeptide repeat-containing protein 2 n=1 Tax=Colletotrichum chlorophyti TaxID=708187 RepID=A0A1Q8S6T8_9PEZI|nr:Small glutamine-rich tetratricopeptide repeat-containing protein 2 [Colletotrichum chlorophyti]
MADMAPLSSGQQENVRRCFICLMDENESGASDSAWVNPCPCTLEGHQDCMIEWVTDLEREGKEIRCPVCKATINIDEPWDPALALNNQVHKSFSKVSPGLILGGLGAGTCAGLAMYGNIALRVFVGPEAAFQFLFSERNGVPIENWAHIAILPAIAPALVIGQSFPVLGNVFFMPAAALYGVFHMARDDNFLSWPPSPQLAAACFPYVRAVYNNLYHEFACSYERKWERRIAGLPEPAPMANNRRVDDNRVRRGRNNAGANGGAAERNGGIVGGLLDAAIDMLDIPDVDVDIDVEIAEAEVEGGAGMPHLDFVVEEVEEIEDGAAAGDDEVEIIAAVVEEQQQQHDDNNDDQNQQAAVQQPAQPAQAAPAPRQRGLQASLRDITNALASTLLLPVFSAGVGELIRLALPRHWTTPTARFGRFPVRTGLLQEQWGRNLVGGCMYIVLRDAFRLYTKYRMAQNKPLRKVRNVDRRRNQASPGATTTKQRLAVAICEFLSSAANDGTIAADDKDSIDVAIQCIADSFKVDPSDPKLLAEAVGAQNLLQVYGVYENLKKVQKPAASASASASASAGASASSEPPKTATEDEKKQAEALKSRGNAAMASKDYPTAISLYTQALALNPSNAVYLSNRAAAHSAAKDHASAKSDAEAAVALDPTYTKAWSRLGLARFALGDAKGAMEAYGKGIEYEGSGGSEAMKKGYETAKRRVEELESEDADLARSSPGGAGGAPGGGMPDLSSLASMLGGGGAGGAGGAGGMPDFSQIMNNPMFASMAQNLMSNPDLMGNLMSNPRLREMADRFGSGGGMPDLNSLMSDPNIAEMARSMMGGGGAPGAPGGGAGAGAGRGGSA